jgi:NAD(P)-dependent dehydrogenase (short-subunit alcohol dehydrogenase family)
VNQDPNHAPEVLTGKVAVVTGGGRGIGAAIAETLARMGAQVVIAGRTPATLEETAGRIRERGGLCLPLACDVSRPGSVEALAYAVAGQFSRVDILVNNAGVGAPAGPLHQLSLEDWDRVLDTNLRGVFHCIRSFVPLMIPAGRGDIINISSLAGKNPLPNGAAYAASKWGLNGLSYSVAEELRQHNIRVTVICPGSTATGLSLHARRESSRVLQPADVAHVVAMVVTQAPQSFASEILLRPTQKP